MPQSIMLDKKTPTVLYISYDGLMEPLGASQVVPYLKGLASKGFVICVVSFEKDLSSYKDRSLALARELSAHGISWKALRYHKNPAVVSTFYDIIRGLMVCLSLSLSRKVRIVHARSYVSSAVAVLFKRFSAAKFIFDMRGFWVDEREEAGLWKKGGWLSCVARHLEKTYYRCCDSIVVLTSAAGSEIKLMPCAADKRVEVIPTCVDLKRFRRAEDPASSLGEKEYTFVYSGSVSTWFDHDSFFCFCRLALSAIPGSGFLVLTREKEAFEVSIGAAVFPEDKIKVVSCEHASMPGYLSLCRAGAAFYRPGYSRKGCSPTKVGEYLACGLPVIINSGIGDMDKIINGENVGVVMEDLSSAEMIKAIDRLKVLFAEGMSLRLRCRSAAEKYFSLEKGIDKYAGIYGELFK